MNKWKRMKEENPLARVYLTILPLFLAAVAVIFVLVKLISGFVAPDQLVLNAVYHDYEEGAELKNPIRVAKDAAFEKEIKSMTEKKSGFTELLVFLEGTADVPDELQQFEEPEAVEEEENGTYQFIYESTKLPETIYVKAPVWWYPVQPEKEAVLPLREGSKEEAEGYGSFEITSVETVKISTGVFNVTVTMTAAGDAVPSNVKLQMGDDVFAEWDGSSELSYDRENGFADRTLVFRYNRNMRDDISDLMEDAKILIPEYTVRRAYKDCEITSNVDGLKIVVVEE